MSLFGRLLGPVRVAGRGASAAGGLPAPDFTSAEQTVTADTLLEVAHSLSVRPSHMEVALRCTTANGGYSIGDEFIFPDCGVGAGAGDESAMYGRDATNVFIVQAVQLAVTDKGTFNRVVLTLTSWRWVVRAWV